MVDPTQQPDPDAAATTTTQAGATAVLDPPANDDASTHVWEPSESLKDDPSANAPGDGLTQRAGQHVQWWFNAEGKVKGADVHVWNGITDGKFQAFIRWDDATSEYVWRDAAGEQQERNQHKTRLRSIVDQAVREGYSEVLAASISP